MTEHEQPHEGGSYVRDKDGKLARVDEQPAAPAADAVKPARSSAKPKKET
jgi:hypothetical protein